MRVGLILCALLLCSGGCASIRVTDPPRTATEQFLLSQAAAEAVGQLSFEPLRGRRVFVDAEYFAAAEEKFVLGELRARLLLSGVELVPQREQAQVIFEVRSGGVGIDREDFLIGLPSLVLTTEESVSVPVRTPEIALVKNIQQVGIASVAYVAYWAETGEVVANSGPYIGRSIRDDWWFFGYGPQTVGDVPTIEAAEAALTDAEREGGTPPVSPEEPVDVDPAGEGGDPP